MKEQNKETDFCFQKYPWTAAMASARRENPLLIIFQGGQTHCWVKKFEQIAHVFVSQGELTAKSYNSSFREEPLWLQARRDEAFGKLMHPTFPQNKQL